MKTPPREPLKTKYHSGAIVASSIHSGHYMSSDLITRSGLSEDMRSREEDPFTDSWTKIVPNHINGVYSRFEFDINRPPENAVYKKPEDAWGLNVWREELDEKLYNRSIEYYNQAYRMLHEYYSFLEQKHGKFVVLDLHSYNYRRAGAEAPPSPEETHPQINIGTGSINKDLWGNLVNRFISDLSQCQVNGVKLNVQENLIFKGAQHSQWTHREFPESGCVIAIEVKKFFMDEWSGVLYNDIHKEIELALASTISGILEELRAN